MAEGLEQDAAAQRRERLREYHRAWRAQCRAEGRCVRCGGEVGAPPSGIRGYCADCSEKVRAARRRRAAARRTRQAGKARREPLVAPPADPVCSHCSGSRVVRCGRDSRGRQRYRCRACGKSSYGMPPPASPGTPPNCPYCGGRCRRAGRSRYTGLQHYRCPDCGRHNTDLRTARPRVAPGAEGPCRHRLTIILNLRAHRNLAVYRAARGLTEAQAIREILAKYAYPSAGATVSRREVDAWGEPRSVIVRRPVVLKGPLRYTGLRLPNLHRPDLTARRQRQVAEGLLLLPRTVGMVRGVTVALDDLAWEGLLRRMTETGRNHQEMAREMIAGARP